MLVLNVLLSIVLLSILTRYVYMHYNTTEPFIMRNKKTKLLKNIKKNIESKFQLKDYRKIVKYILRSKDNTSLLDIIYNHYKKHEDKDGFKVYMIENTDLINENDNIDCKVFKHCTTNGCGSLMSTIKTLMEETETCAHHKSVLADIKQLINENKNESKEE